MNPQTAKFDSEGNGSGLLTTSGGSMHDEVAVPEQVRDKQAARKPAGIRIWEEIKDEFERQRAALARKEVANAQIALLGSILGELLSQAEFVAVLKAAGFTTIPCLIRQRLQPQFPEARAVPARPVTESDIVSCRQDRQINTLEEAATILAGKTLPVRAIQALDRMSPLRRIAVANLMNAVDNVKGDFAQALLAATPDGMRTHVARSQRVDSRRTQSFARIEKQLLAVHARNEILSAGHNDSLHYLAVCVSYIRGWTHNGDVLAWLRLRYPTYVVSFERIVEEADCANEPKRPMKLPYVRDRTTVPAKEIRRRGHTRGT
ncbi:plasmid partitioning protein RepB C-terminal domain-containing protein [Paraburkholderia sp. D1E]|uniref:plasmid partitioning protein RepB C-terminal domain-containing protein n=1 Tax=Paraburkholderia sp. D1E TaxID=3461398 RepID=UPI0040456ECA